MASSRSQSTKTQTFEKTSVKTQTKNRQASGKRKTMSIIFFLFVVPLVHVLAQSCCRPTLPGFSLAQLKVGFARKAVLCSSNRSVLADSKWLRMPTLNDKRVARRVSKAACAQRSARATDALVLGAAVQVCASYHRARSPNAPQTIAIVAGSQYPKRGRLRTAVRGDNDLCRRRHSVLRVRRRSFRSQLFSLSSEL